MSAGKWECVRPGLHRCGDWMCERQPSGRWWVLYVSTSEPMMTGCGTLAEAKYWAAKLAEQAA